MRSSFLTGIVALAFAGVSGTASPQIARTPPATPNGPALDMAYGAYQRGYYLTAFREATLRIEKNPDDAAAMALMGELYNQGLGVLQDLGKAADWYRLAAQRGDAHAAFALAMMKLQGRGVETNEAEGLQLLEQAAASGHPAASYNRALTLMGSGDPSQAARAVSLLQHAVAAEVADAQYMLAMLHKQGRGVAKDLTKAADLMRRAAANGLVAAQVESAIMLFNGEGVKKDEAAAARLFARAAAQGNAVAGNRLARLLVAGRGVSKDLVEAAGWHLAAAGKGLTDAWLDDALKSLTPDERKKAEELADQRLDGLQAGLKP